MLHNIFIILLLAHVLGDFYFQTENMAKEKENHIQGVILHCMEYSIVALAVSCMFTNFEFTKSCFYLGIAHLIIDILKYLFLNNDKRFNEERYKIYIFVFDQIFHLATILLIAYSFTLENPSILSFAIYDIIVPKTWEIIIVILLIMKPANIFIKIFLSKYKFTPNDANLMNNDTENTDKTSSNGEQTDIQAGALIGSLERIIIFVFIYLQAYSAIGFTLTAKSIVRFNKMNEQNFAEYYLLGTLLSTIIVIACTVILIS